MPDFFNASCAAAHRVPIPIVTDRTSALKEAAAKKRTALHGSRISVSDPEITAELTEAFSKISYSSDAQRNERYHDAEAVTLRYAHYLQSYIATGWHRLQAPLLSLELGGTKTPFRPDVLLYRKTGEGIFLKAIIVSSGKAAVSQTGANNGTYKALRLYAAMRYLERVSKKISGHKILTASMHYMRRNDDRYANPGKPGFFNETFDAPKGGNIVSITEEMYGLVKKRYAFRTGRKGIEVIATADWDAIYAPAVKQMNDGMEEEQCSDDDCERCPFYDSCKYVLPPLQVKGTVSKSSKLMIPSKNQAMAIGANTGVLRINAGPGAGKTFVITKRVERLLDEGVKPSELLLITFTDAAAKEMRDRISAAVAVSGVVDSIDDMRICTFNSFGNEVILDQWANLGFTAEPTLLKNVTRRRIISDLLIAHPVSGMAQRNFDANSKFVKGPVVIADEVFDTMKRESYTVYDVDKVYESLGMDRRYITKDALKNLMELYDEFDETLRASNYIEYADQESLVFEVLHRDPFYFNKLQLKHIIVDEFQDTSENQMKILKALVDTPSCESLMVVGDDSQAVYGFRNTSPEYIINFASYIGKPVRDIGLLENHRSTPEIVDFANKLMDKNTKKIAKTLTASRASIGKPVITKGFFSADDEYSYIVNGIKKKISMGTKPEDIAFIGYTKTELMKMADLLKAANIPSVLMNPEPLHENSRVRAAIAMLKAVKNHFDTKDTLTVANALTPNGDLIKADPEAIKRAYGAARKRLDEIGGLKEAPKRAELLKLLNEFDRDDEVYQGFIDMLKSQPSVEQMMQYALDFERFGEDEAIRRSRKYPGVVLTTAHSSKGLEWKIVYNSLTKYDSEQIRSKLEYTEERRRLLYVSATRARDELIITGLFTAYIKKDPDNPKVSSVTRNMFLIDSYECSGNPIDNMKIAAAEADYRAEKKAQKAASADGGRKEKMNEQKKCS